MKPSLFLPIFLAAQAMLTAIPTESAAAAADSFPVNLEASAWTFAPELKAENQDGRLILTSAAKTDWAGPVGRWSASSGLELRVEGDAGGGNIIVQVEWFDRSGALVSADEVFRVSGAGVQEKDGKMVPPPKAAAFGLKFWFEGESIHASLAGITLSRVPVWPSGEALESVPAQENAKFEADSGIASKSEGTTCQMVLEEGTGYAGIHLNNPVALREGLRVLVPVLELPSGTSLSVQALCWDRQGAFLGEVDLIKDITEAGDYEVKVPAAAMEFNPAPAKVSTKVWLTGKAGRPVRVGAVRFAAPSEK